MDFEGWAEFISPSQLHFFFDVHGTVDTTTVIGYRHFNCSPWGSKDFTNADTLVCVCTTYVTPKDQLGDPLASREILVRQKNSNDFEEFKKNVASLPADSLPWLEKFLPKDDSYLFQIPRLNQAIKQ